MALDESKLAIDQMNKKLSHVLKFVFHSHEIHCNVMYELSV